MQGYTGNLINHADIKIKRYASILHCGYNGLSDQPWADHPQPTEEEQRIPSACLDFSRGGISLPCHCPAAADLRCQHRAKS